MSGEEEVKFVLPSLWGKVGHIAWKIQQGFNVRNLPAIRAHWHGMTVT